MIDCLKIEQKYFDIFRTLFVDGGFTIDKEFNKINVETGYVVSLAGYEEKRHLRFLSTESLIYILTEKVRQIENMADDGNNVFIGAWIDGDYVYFDCSIIMQDRVAAIELAHKNQQKAIYNLKKGESIYLTWN